MVRGKGPTLSEAGGLLLQNQAGTTTVVNPYEVAALRLSGVAYRQEIEYLPEPLRAQIPVHERIVRAHLPLRREVVSIRAGGQNVVLGARVIRNEAGMIVTLGNSDTGLTFLSIPCIEVMELANR